MSHSDPVTAFFLICFLAGAALTTLTFLFGLGSGALHVGPLHLPGHVVASQPGHAIGGDVFHGHGFTTNGGGHGGVHHIGHVPDSASPFNTLSILMFVAWFGGVGYLLRIQTSLVVWLILAVAIIAGLVAGGAIFFVLARVLLPHQTILDPRDYEMVGTVGRVTVTVHAGGTGEMVFIKGGTRFACAARGALGAPLDKGIEVVVVRHERGVAYVQPWSEFLDASSIHDHAAEDVTVPTKLEHEVDVTS